MKTSFSLAAVVCAIQVASVTTIAFAETGTATTKAKKPNILWIIAENIGPDLGCYGYPTVATPHLDRLAREGLRYRLACDTAPVCSASRSCFMTGMYQTTIGAHNHRSHRSPGLDDHFLLPANVRPLPHWLREAGYFTANITTLAGRPVGTGKTDLNFEVEGDVLRPGETLPTNAPVETVQHNFKNSVRLFQATEWTQLPRHQPFYAQVNLPTVERGGGSGWTGSRGNPWQGQSHPATTDPTAVILPPYYPDHPIVRQDWAGYIDAINGLDTRVGEILARLKADGLADDTVVFFFADNGRLEFRGLDWCYDSGDRVPLIVRWPKNFPAPPQYRANAVSEQLISLIDLTATTLAIGGVAKPPGMQSRVFLGAKGDPAREAVFSARDRTDEAVQRIRAMRGPRYRYIRNFMPDHPFMAPHRYKEASYPVVPLLRKLHAEGKLGGPPLALMVPRLPDEELYDTEADPSEIHNLATSSSSEHQRTLREMRATLENWIEETGDQGRNPESPAVRAHWTEVTKKMFSLRPDQPRPPSAPLAADSRRPLWDGRSFAGWHPIGKGVWTIENGAIHGVNVIAEKEYGHLVSDRIYGDFTLRLKFNSVKGNSGLYFRIEETGFSGVTGFQAEIDATKDVGGLYETNGRKWVSQPTPAQVATWFKPGEWNELIVTARGGHIVVRVNGKISAELSDDPGRREGRFALQLHGGKDVEVWFKDIELQ